MFHFRWTLRLTSIFVLLNLLSCGPSNTVTITIIPSVGYHPKKFHELSREFFNQDPAPFTNVLNNNNSCRQMFVRSAITHSNNGANIDTFVIPNMRTAMPSPTPFDAAWMNTPGNVEFETPIQIQAPKGEYTEVGLFGVLNRPFDNAPVDGVCDNLAGVAALPSYHMFGHVSLGVPNDAMTVPLGIFMFEANPAVTPFPPARDGFQNIIANSPSSGYSGGYFCSNADNTATCPIRDIVEIRNVPPMSPPTSYCKIIKVEYMAGNNGTPPISNFLTDPTLYPSTSGHFYVPHSNSYNITLINTSTANQITITSSDNAIYSTANLNLPVVCDSTQIIKIGKVGLL